MLEPGGEVRLVDAVDDYDTVESPVFLRPPSDPQGEPRLHWVRILSSPEVDIATGRPNVQTMVLTEKGPAPVDVDLRHEEAVLSIHGYPGASTFSATLVHRSDIPTCYEIVEVRSRPGASRSERAWPLLVRRTRTGESSAAWVSPEEWVATDFRIYRPDLGFEVRRFRAGCPGHTVAYRGAGIDSGAYIEAHWPYLPFPPRGVLVLAAGDAQRAGHRRAGEAVERLDAYPGGPWLTYTTTIVAADPARHEVVELRDGGRVRATLTLWSRQEPRADTDTPGAAWLTALDFATRVADDAAPQAGARVSCGSASVADTARRPSPATRRSTQAPTRTCPGTCWRRGLTSSLSSPPPPPTSSDPARRRRGPHSSHRRGR